MMQKLLLIPLCFLVCEAMAQLEIFRDKKTKKYGYNNTEKDSVAIAPIFDKAENFMGNFAWAKSKRKWGLINQQGVWVLPPAYNVWQETEENFCIVKKKGKFGLVNLSTGKETVVCLYKKTFYFEELNGFGVAAVVIKKKKAGLIDRQGKELVPCLYDVGKRPFAEAAPRFYQVKQKKKMGLIDWTGAVVVPCRYDEVMPDDNETISTKRKGKYGLYKTNGAQLTDCQYESTLLFDNEGYAVAKKNGKFGLIDRRGRLVLPCEYANEEALFTALQKLKK